MITYFTRGCYEIRETPVTVFWVSSASGQNFQSRTQTQSRTETQNNRHRNVALNVTSRFRTPDSIDLWPERFKRSPTCTKDTAHTLSALKTDQYHSRNTHFKKRTRLKVDAHAATLGPRKMRKHTICDGICRVEGQQFPVLTR